MSLAPKEIPWKIEIVAEQTTTPGLIVHRAWNPTSNDPEWTVTHMASGKKLHSNNFYSRHNAHKFASMLKKAADWTDENPMKDWSPKRKQKIVDFRDAFMKKDLKEFNASKKEEKGKTATKQAKAPAKKSKPSSKRR